MAAERSAEGIKELTAWLERNDAKGRTMRVERLQDLLDILPVPSDGLSFLEGEESLICFAEIRRCYLDRSDIAVVLLCLSYAERELAAQLYVAGWEDAKNARLGAVLEKAYKDGGHCQLVEGSALLPREIDAPDRFQQAHVTASHSTNARVRSRRW